MNMIAIVDREGGLGYRGELLFHIPADLKRFQELTWGHTVILGRRTLATFPGGKPLPGRNNLILSKTPHFTCPGAIIIPDLSTLLKRDDLEQAFVIGGESIYCQLLPYTQRIYLTRVNETRPADCFFPSLDQTWQLKEEGPWQAWEDINFRYQLYENKLFL